MRAQPGRAADADEDGGSLEFLLGVDTAPGGVEGDDRRTSVGRFLRRTSLDELPQLFNVLKGDMSLIGPRPERPEFVEMFMNDIVRYGDRHRVKSGITGWAQVHGLRGQTSLAERVEWDNYYIAHWSLGLDAKILALTMAAVFRNAE
jgi:lipopolysaccharide/colanic/teichoic acid biosynthesis glycosyltransferase